MARGKEEKPTKIYLWRHPETMGAEEKRYIGHSDVRLSAKGNQQTVEIARVMSQYRLGGIYASDLSRCRQPAAEISKTQRKRMKVAASNALREMNMGRWEKRTFADVARASAAEMEARMADLVNYRIPEGESVQDLANRVLPAFRQIVENHRGQEVAIIAHGGPNRVILCWLMGAGLDRIFTIEQDYACLNVIEVHPDGWPVLKRVNLPLFGA